MATLGEMLIDVKARCARESDSSLDSNFRTWLNQGQNNVQTRYIWPFLEAEGTVTTVASTENYDLPTNLRYLHLVRDTSSSRILDFVSISDFYRSIPNPTATGNPYAYRLPGNTQDTSTDNPVAQIAFYPIPDAAYTLKIPYYRFLASMVNPNDTSAIPIEFHELMVHYAAKIYWSREGDARANSANDDYENMLTDMVKQYGAQPVDRMDVLGSSDGGGMPTAQLPPSFGRLNWR